MEHAISNHDSRISITKAICIILMVVGHSGINEVYPYIGHLICNFIMPAFFFVSGFCFKDKNLDKPVEFFKRRVTGLYWPFVKWSVIFLLLHNVLSSLNLYNEYYSVGDFLGKAFAIFTMRGSEQLLGGHWIFYAIVGVVVPVYIWKLIHFIKQRINKSSFDR